MVLILGKCDLAMEPQACTVPRHFTNRMERLSENERLFEGKNPGSPLRQTMRSGYRSTDTGCHEALRREAKKTRGKWPSRVWLLTDRNRIRSREAGEERR